VEAATEKTFIKKKNLATMDAKAVKGYADEWSECECGGSGGKGGKGR